MMPYYGKEFSFCQLSCNDGSSLQVCHIDKSNNNLIIITDKGHYYSCNINGLNTKIDSTISLYDKTKQKIE